MNSTKSVARWIGLLPLLQIAAGAVVNFMLLGPVFQNPPGFLLNAAPQALAVRLAVLFEIGLAAASVGIAIAAWPVFRRHSERMALWLIVLAAAGLALSALEGVGLMSMLSLSQAFAAAGAPDGDLYPALRGVVTATRNWSHFIRIAIAGAFILVLFVTLFRFRLVPRVLAGFGAAAALLQMSALSMPLFGQPIAFLMLAPLGIAVLGLAAWLLTKGLLENPVPEVDRPVSL